MNQKDLKKLFGIICIALAVVAVIVLAIGVFAISGEEVPLIKTLVIIVSLLCFAAAAEFGFMYYVENEVERNFFLYDAQTNKNIPVEKMSFDMVNRKMNLYLSRFAPNEGRLWTDRILEDPKLGMEDKFKPAVAYRLLYGLADKDMDQGWACFEAASPETVEFICAALDMNDDKMIARTLRYLKSSSPLNLKDVRDFLVTNKRYLRTKLSNYIYENISKF